MWSLLPRVKKVIRNYRDGLTLTGGGGRPALGGGPIRDHDHRGTDEENV